MTLWLGWLGSRVVSVLHSGAEQPGVQIAVATLSGNSFRQSLHTHCASVHQAAKLVAALIRVAGVTTGLSESNGSLPPGWWLTSPAGWLPRTGISCGTRRSVIEYGLPLPVTLSYMAAHMINPSTSINILCLLILELLVITSPTGYHWKRAASRDPVTHQQGFKNN